MNSGLYNQKQNGSDKLLQEKLELLYEKAILNYKYVEGSKLAQAFLDAHSVLKNDPKNLTRLGLIYDHAAMVNKKNQKILESKARKNYKQALILDKISPSAWWGLARIYWHNGNKRAIPYAVKAYHFAKASSADDVGQYAQNLGLVYKKLGNNQRAKYWLKRGIDESPHEWGVHYNLMRFYLDTNDRHHARESAKNLLVLLKKEKINSRWMRDVRHVAKTTADTLEK